MLLTIFSGDDSSEESSEDDCTEDQMEAFNNLKDLLAKFGQEE